MNFLQELLQGRTSFPSSLPSTLATSSKIPEETTITRVCKFLLIFRLDTSKNVATAGAQSQRKKNGDLNKTGASGMAENQNPPD